MPTPNPKAQDDLRAQLATVTAERDALKQLIERSDLVEVEVDRVSDDGCGGIVLKSAGKKLFPRDHAKQVEQRTKDLQQLAAKARETAALKQRSERLEKALEGMVKMHTKVPNRAAGKLMAEAMDNGDFGDIAKNHPAITTATYFDGIPVAGSRELKKVKAQRDLALRTLALARDYVDDISLTSDGVISRKAIVRMIDLLIPARK